MTDRQEETPRRADYIESIPKATSAIIKAIQGEYSKRLSRALQILHGTDPNLLLAGTDPSLDVPQQMLLTIQQQNLDAAPFRRNGDSFQFHVDHTATGANFNVDVLWLPLGNPNIAWVVDWIEFYGAVQALVGVAIPSQTPFTDGGATNLTLTWLERPWPAGAGPGANPIAPLASAPAGPPLAVISRAFGTQMTSAFMTVLDSFPSNALLTRKNYGSLVFAQELVALVIATQTVNIASGVTIQGRVFSFGTGTAIPKTTGQ